MNSKLWDFQGELDLTLLYHVLDESLFCVGLTTYRDLQVLQRQMLCSSNFLQWKGPRAWMKI